MRLRISASEQFQRRLLRNLVQVLALASIWVFDGTAAQSAETRTCVQTVGDIYEGHIFGTHTYDKWKHCYASCLLAQRCDPLQACAAGLLKEIVDFIGSNGLFLARKLHAPWWVVGFFQRINGEPDPLDLLADGRGIVCAFSDASCSDCCDIACP